MQKAPLNIVMLTTVRLHQSKGGIEKVMLDTANAMVERGHKVTIIFRDKKGSDPGFRVDSRVKLVNCAAAKTPLWYNSAICDLRSFSFSKKKKNYKKAILNLKTTAARYREAITAHPADIYLTYDPKLSAMLVKEFGVKQPVISTFQFDPAHIIKRYYFEAIKPLIVQAGPIQVLTPAFAETIRSAIPQANCLSIPNVVRPIEEKADLSNPTIINVGRVMSLKNQKLIVQAMALLHDKYPNWIVKIFGETDLDLECFKEIETLVKTNNLQNVVQFCGVVNDVEKELLSSSIFVFPSISEGFSLALTEAMSAGLPCVGLRSCLGVRYLVKDEVSGLLCDDTPESLAGAMERLMVDINLRRKFGEQAKLSMVKYQPEQIWKQWEEVLYSLI